MNYICSMNNWVELERQLPFQKPPTLPVNCDLPFSFWRILSIFHLIWLTTNLYFLCLYSPRKKMLLVKVVLISVVMEWVTAFKWKMEQLSRPHLPTSSHSPPAHLDPSCISKGKWKVWPGNTQFPNALKSVKVILFTFKIMNWAPYLNFPASWWLGGKEFTCQCKRDRIDPWSREIP